MAVFEVQGPDGRTFEIEGPDAAGAAEAFRRYIGSGDAPSAAPASTATAPAQAPAEITNRPLWQRVADNVTDRVQTANRAVAEGVANLPQYLTDLWRVSGDTATFGLSDEALAKGGELLGRGTYDERLAHERQLLADAEDRAGWAGTGARLATGAGMAVIGGGLPAVGRLIAPAAGTSLLGRAGAGALTGAAGGAAYGFGSGEGEEDRVNSALTSGAIGGVLGGAFPLVTGALTAGANSVAGRVGRAAGVNRPQAVPSQDEIRAAGRAAYGAAEDAGVIFNSEGTGRLAREVRDDLAEFGYHPQLQPRVAPVLAELEKLAEGNVTLKGLEQIRKVANNARAGSMDNSERAVLNGIIDKLDGFVTNAKPGEVMTGDSAAGAAALKEARGLWSRAAKMADIENATRRAELRAGSTGKGANVDNATRQNVRRILDKGARGYTPDEKALLEQIVLGTRPGQNTARQIGQFAPTGVVSSGLSAQIGAGIGSALAGPAGAVIGAGAVPAAGAIGKTIADRATVRSVDDLLATIAAGGSRAAAGGGPNALQRVIEAVGPFVPGPLAATTVQEEDRTRRKSKAQRRREREARRKAAAAE